MYAQINSESTQTCRDDGSIMTMDSQISASWLARGTVQRMRDRPATRVRKSKLRDPQVLELASQGVVEVITGGADDVAMLPWRSLVGLDSILDYAEAFVQMHSVAQHPDVPRALLGEYAFFADLSSEDRSRFLSDFGEALAGSIQAGDPSSARVLVNSYRTATSHPRTTSSAFNGEFGKEVDAVLASRVPRR